MSIGLYLDNFIFLYDCYRNSIEIFLTAIFFFLIGPRLIDFGEVCVKSVSMRYLEFFNTLDQPIHIEIEVMFFMEDLTGRKC